MKRLLMFSSVVALLLAKSAGASFHTFQIEEIFSNADGTVQYIVLHEVVGANGQNFLGGLKLTSTHNGAPKVYTFTNDLPGGLEDGDGYGGYYMMPSPTAHKRVLIATPGFVALGLVTPDYTIPPGFLSTSGGTVDYAGADQWTYNALPTDGSRALYRDGSMKTNLATNFSSDSAVVTLAQPATPNYEGLWWNAPATSESGWGINFAHQGDVIFATWFTYDLNGKAWWLTMTANKTADGTYSGALVQTHGPPFSAVLFDPAMVTATPVGTGTLTFADNDNGAFAYTVNGVAQTKTITRQVFGAMPTCSFGGQTDLTQATNYQDLWWVPAGAESGWGVNFTHQGDVIFATWFTYNADGTPLWLSVTAPKTGPNSYSGTLIRTAGPAFNAVPFAPASVTLTPVGTLTISFANGNSASFAYTVSLPGQSSVTQAKTLTRQVFRTPGTICQ